MSQGKTVGAEILGLACSHKVDKARRGKARSDISMYIFVHYYPADAEDAGVFPHRNTFCCSIFPVFKRQYFIFAPGEMHHFHPATHYNGHVVLDKREIIYTVLKNLKNLMNINKATPFPNNNVPSFHEPFIVFN